jgi:integral membrane protein (TIGR01906 family)
MPRRLTNLLSLIITLGVPVILILSNVLLFMNPAWLAFQYAQPNFPASVQFTPQDRLHFGSESIEYVRGNRTLEQFRALGVYQEREIKHMIDVRVLVDRVKIVLPVVALLAIIALIVLARQLDTRALAAHSLLNGARLTIGIFVAIGIFAAVGFQLFFTLFHRIFFEGDTWLFNYTDSLIQFYPTPFWFATSLALVALTIVEAIIIGAIGWWGKLSKQ